MIHQFKNIKLSLFFVLQIVCIAIHGTNNDSIFFDNVKRFAFKEMGDTVDADLFTKWKADDNPYYYLYLSDIDKVHNGRVGTEDPYIYCSSEKEALDKGNNFNSNYTTYFIYKAYMNSDALLNKRFISYRRESQAFIIFHELTHNFIIENKLDFPYEFNEALCDVVGNYGALKYAQSTKNINLKITQNQLQLNEKIYECLNTYIDLINAKPDRSKLPFYEIECHDKMKELLKNSDGFQKDRFDDYVTTGYLLKNYYYCHNYFLIKKVFQKQGSIKGLLEVIMKMPNDVAACTKYLEDNSK